MNAPLSSLRAAGGSWPTAHTTTCAKTATCKTITFVPVDGRTVFFTCLFLIVICLVWLALWLHRGIKFEEDA